MNSSALVLVLVAACLHATWNLLAKRIGGGVTAVWLYDSVALVIYAPITLIVIFWQHPRIDSVALVLMVGSGLFHLGYFIFLQLGYRKGDLSLIYPLARGTGPLLSTIAAVIFLGERPTLIAFIGVLLIVLGVFLISGGLRLFGRREAYAALFFGIVTGVFIAMYTLWDKEAVSTFLVSPLLYFYGATIVRVALLAPYTARHWQTASTEWREHHFKIIGVGILSPLAYFLILVAFTLAPVSYVAPGREISVLLGTLMGARLLEEGDAKRRLLAASIMLLGIIMLAI
ncbi:MAG TPA: DMT family transporter [Ktedonobacteraceae bacterium]